MADTTIQTAADQWYRVTYRARGRRKVYAAERFGVAAGTIDGMDVLSAVPFPGPRADGRKDCPACGHHGSRCQEDLDNGSTICHTTGAIICPGCGAGLNKLAGKDGHQVALVAGDGGRAVEARTMATIYACPACEFIGTKNQAVAL